MHNSWFIFVRGKKCNFSVCFIESRTKKWMAPAHQMTHITEYMQFMIYLNNVINANTVTSHLNPALLHSNLSFHFCFLSFSPCCFWYKHTWLFSQGLCYECYWKGRERKFRYFYMMSYILSAKMGILPEREWGMFFSCQKAVSND